MCKLLYLLIFLLIVVYVYYNAPAICQPPPLLPYLFPSCIYLGFFIYLVLFFYLTDLVALHLAYLSTRSKIDFLRDL